MKVSDNDFFNSVVSELYCPTVDLSTVIRYEMFKAFKSTSMQNTYLSVIRLFDAEGSIVCSIFYDSQDSEEKSLSALENGYYNKQQNYIDSDGTKRQYSIKSILNWDCEGFTPGVSHKGPIQISEAYKDIRCNKIIALYLRMKGNNQLHPFYNIVSAKLVMKYEGDGGNDWYLKVKDRKGIEHTTVINSFPKPLPDIFPETFPNKGFLKTEFGILEIKFIPLAEEEELEVCAMFDSADGGLSMYKYANIDLSKWRPTPGSGIIWTDDDKYPSFIDIVQDADVSQAQKYRMSNCIVTWRALEPMSVNIEMIRKTAEQAASNRTKFNLVFMPSTLSPTTTNCGRQIINGEYIYYHFPEHIYAILKGMEHALYVVDITNIYHVETAKETYGDKVKVYVINWHIKDACDLYCESCKNIVNALASTPVIDNSPRMIIEYIDIVKVAFWGSWGEGVAYDEIIGGDPNAPTASELIKVSENIIELFNTITVNGKKQDIICLLPLMSYFNCSFPQEYRDYILAGRTKETKDPDRIVGYFFDGVGSNIEYWCFEKAHSFDYDVEVMNELHLAHQTRPIYLECAQYVSGYKIPSYQNLINFVRYFRCAYFNPQNIFFESKDCKYNEIAMLKDISRYVGVKLALLSFNYGVISTNKINIRLRLLNCGTSKIYHNNWKLRYYLIGASGNVKDAYDSDLDLRQIKAAFEEDAPNWHDVADFNTTASGTTSKVIGEDVEFNSATTIETGDKLYIAIEDTTGIYENMYLSNSEDYIQRDENGRYKLFTI